MYCSAVHVIRGPPSGAVSKRNVKVPIDPVHHDLLLDAHVGTTPLSACITYIDASGGPSA
jgi:hypothetical protein